MRAALMTAFGDPVDAAITVTEVADPALPADGVVLEVLASGVCRSDWHAWRGHDPTIRLPHVGGHEMSGRVVAVGAEVRHHRVGDLVTVPFCMGCSHCRTCRDGNPQVCDDEVQPGFTQWGSFAELVALPHADLNLVPLPPDSDPVAMAALGCRFMTAWAAVVEHAGVRPDDWVAVHGCGGLGLSAVMIGAALGLRVVAVDIDGERLELARELGAEQTVRANGSEPADGEPPGGGRVDTARADVAAAGVTRGDVTKGDVTDAVVAEVDVAAAVVEVTGGGAYASLDAVGSAATARASIRSVRKRGTHVQVGLMLGADRDAALPMARVISYELTLRGVHGMAVRHYPALVEAVASGRVDPARLVGARVGLDDVPGELAAMTAYQQRGLSVVTSFGR